MLGRNHPLLRRLRALRRDAALRRSERLLVAEGLHLVGEALASGAEVQLAVVSPALGDRSEGRELLAALHSRAVPVHETAPRWLDALQDARSAQPILALVRWGPLSAEALLDTLNGNPLVIVAYGVQDPGNLGSIVRTADAAGAAALLTCGASADLTHPRTVRATAGSVFQLPLAHAEHSVLLRALRERGLRLLGSAPRAPLSHDQADWTGGVALFLGSEGAGLPPEILEAVDQTVGVPLRPGVESLSVGAAAAVLLFAAARQRTGS